MTVTSGVTFMAYGIEIEDENLSKRSYDYDPHDYWFDEDLEHFL